MANLSNLKEIVKAGLKLSNLMDGAEKLSTNDVVDKELTMNDCDSIQFSRFVGYDNDKAVKENVSYSICTFAEFPNKFYNCGSVLGNICDQIIANDMREELRATGLKIRLYRDFNGSGFEMTMVDLL